MYLVPHATPSATSEFLKMVKNWGGWGSGAFKEWITFYAGYRDRYFAGPDRDRWLETNGQKRLWYGRGNLHKTNDQLYPLSF